MSRETSKCAHKSYYTIPYLIAQNVGFWVKPHVKLGVVFSCCQAALAGSGLDFDAMFKHFLLAECSDWSAQSDSSSPIGHLSHSSLSMRSLSESTAGRRTILGTYVRDYIKLLKRIRYQF